MKRNLFVTMALLSSLSLPLPACTADATGAASKSAPQATPMVSTYEHQGSLLELTGRPLATGLFDVTIRLQTPQGTRSVELDSETTEDDALPALRDTFEAIGADMLDDVRSTISATPLPQGETDARWLSVQQSIFSMRAGSPVRPEISCGDLGGYWYDCGGVLHCCVFSHSSICGFLCKL
jgi:hypothetical protein